MKLTKEQIDLLKKMISKKGYVHIDVQYEILDHVACKIEELLEKRPTLSLEDAFRKVHSSFGIFGFSTLEESYTKSIQARVKKYFLQEMSAFLSSYRILYPILLGLLIYQVSVILNDPKAWVLILSGFLILTSLAFIGSYWPKYQRLKNFASFSTSSNLFQLVNFGIICCLYSYQWVYKVPQGTDSLFFHIFQGGIILVMVCFALSMFVLPRVLDQSIEETEALKRVYGE
ncbi:hypothetical protein [Algoriphagus formosus]|uniref:hypothetical protein n=1 Tax=Algoriphagus formosus TaxID=2007308 RepID=UPI000C28A716|nr:hypothetical protein [Algoriphagus formosus]